MSTQEKVNYGYSPYGQEGFSGNPPAQPPPYTISTHSSGYGAPPGGMSAPYVMQPASTSTFVTIGAVGVLERENTPPPDTTCGLIVSILVLIFCAWPCGIGSIVFNRRANEYKLLGQHTLARASLRTSTIWNVIGVITGIIAWAIIGVYIYRLNQVVDDFYGN